MKRLFVFYSILLSLNINAQDIIILRNGDEIESKVVKVGDEIEYKKWSNQDGPIYTLKRDDVFMVKYVNGEKDIFDRKENSNETTVKTEIPKDGFVRRAAAENNQSIIDKYNVPIHFAQTKPKDKKSDLYFPIMAMSESSIASTDELELNIVPTRVWESGYFSGYKFKYTIELKNKSDKTIYIDLANSFKIYCDETSDSFYNSETKTISKGSGTAVGMGIGLLGVGANNQSAVSTTYASDRILAIPPHSTKDLNEYKRVHIKKDEYVTISDLEEYALTLRPGMQRPNKNGYVSYTEENSPYTREYIITYSTSQDFSEYSSLNVKLYARYIYGGWIGSFLPLSASFKNALRKVQKYISNFWTDPGVIVGRN